MQDGFQMIFLILHILYQLYLLRLQYLQAITPLSSTSLDQELLHQHQIYPERTGYDILKQQGIYIIQDALNTGDILEITKCIKKLNVIVQNKIGQKYTNRNRPGHYSWKQIIISNINS